jgi:hypothetical protein
LRQFAQQCADRQGRLEVRHIASHVLRRIGIPVRCITINICSLSLGLAQ